VTTTKVWPESAPFSLRPEYIAWSARIKSTESQLSCAGNANQTECEVKEGLDADELPPYLGFEVFDAWQGNLAVTTVRAARFLLNLMKSQSAT
jgi:hypothetical protein